MRSTPRLLAALLALTGCSPSIPPQGATGETTAPPATPATPPAATAPVTTSPPAPAAKTPEPEVLASDSSPPGVTRLSKEESALAKKTCMPLADAMTAAAKKQKLAGAADRNAFIEEFLAHPPQLPRVDVARCADLLLRDVRAYVAATIESEAMMNLGRVVFGLAASLDREPPQLCAGAGPVPSDLGALAAGPWVSKTEDWAAPGWGCAHFNLAGESQRFQYQLVTDGKAGTWEVVARGFPVKGGAPTELYARGRIEEGHIKPSREVYRRAAAR